MGADLYKQRRYEEARALHEASFHLAVKNRDESTDPLMKDALQREVELAYNQMQGGDLAYFRDSYNNSNLMWQFELSWWQNLEGCINPEGIITPTGAKKLLKLLKSKEDIFHKKIENEDAENKAYFLEKYERFKLFLQDSVDNKLKIDCSC